MFTEELTRMQSEVDVIEARLKRQQADRALDEIMAEPHSVEKWHSWKLVASWVGTYVLGLAVMCGIGYLVAEITLWVAGVVR